MGLLSLFTRRSVLGPQNLVMVAFTKAIFTRDLRGLPFTAMLDAQRLADGTGLTRRRIVPVIVGALIFGVVISGVLHLWLTYQHGGLQMYYYSYRINNTEYWGKHAPLMSGTDDWRPARLLSLTAGIGTMVFLGFMRRAYHWWPLHPLGLPLALTWTVNVFWFPALVAWVLKGLVNRYGGMRLYLKLRPLFLGLVFGEFSMAVLWTVLATVFEVRAPMFPWP
jgi:hypothetical protein